MAVNSVFMNMKTGAITAIAETAKKGLTKMARNCHDIECQPPCSSKEDCDLFDNGKCTGIYPPNKTKHCFNCGCLLNCSLVATDPRKQFTNKNDCPDWKPVL